MSNNSLRAKRRRTVDVELTKTAVTSADERTQIFQRKKEKE